MEDSSLKYLEGEVHFPYIRKINPKFKLFSGDFCLFHSVESINSINGAPGTSSW